jgi:hypothetical protein
MVSARVRLRFFALEEFIDPGDCEQQKLFTASVVLIEEAKSASITRRPVLGFW